MQCAVPFGDFFDETDPGKDRFYYEKTHPWSRSDAPKKSPLCLPVMQIHTILIRTNYAYPSESRGEILENRTRKHYELTAPQSFPRLKGLEAPTAFWS